LRDFFFCGMFLNVYIRTVNLRYRKETCAAVTSTVALKITGKPDGRLDFHLHVAHACQSASNAVRTVETFCEFAAPLNLPKNNTLR